MGIGSQIDVLSLFGRFTREQRISLHDPKATELFLSSITTTVADALQNGALQHGQRVQNMFEALIISLGDYKLLKMEDNGRVHPEGSYIAPDFRLVLKDGTQWLIDVKNVFLAAPEQQRLVLRKVDVDKLTAYAEATGCPLKIAVYWALWRVWSLVDAADLAPISDKKLAIDMLESLRLSQLGRVGDRTIGTKPPLTLRLVADRTKERSITSNGEVVYTVAAAKLFCDGNEIKNPVERDLAWTFMQYGDWAASEPLAILDSEDLPEAVEFEWKPPERSNPGEHFEMIGRLSSMFSRYYAERTVGPDGLTQTEADLVPNWFAPLLDTGHESDALPLWRFVIQAGRRP
ncbi:hypothetical protein B5E41_30065 [Rhizobium esperanzae]|uniref:Restriction endonuclease n=1 Tax=Rhizobium esperanzae TaxID=1967781 RepID=A0A246DKV2_9HYPH|nr:hypothetical protein [Rhizobium esperanzae]OWO89727.1 hypothetical protein B5E41_30065 [Rhizobium esperanzae]